MKLKFEMGNKYLIPGPYLFANATLYHERHPPPTGTHSDQGVLLTNAEKGLGSDSRNLFANAKPRQSLHRKREGCLMIA